MKLSTLVSYLATTLRNISISKALAVVNKVIKLSWLHISYNQLQNKSATCYYLFTYCISISFTLVACS